MKKLSIAAALLLNLVAPSATGNDSFTNDLKGCQAFAATFDNTCTSTTAGAFTAIPKKPMKCGMRTVKKCAGIKSPDG